VTLTEAIAHWVHDAVRMAAGAVERLVVTAVVTAELFECLVREQADQAPAVAGAAVVQGVDLADYAEMVEIAGPDRVALYVGSGDAPYPLGLDPAMPVVFVPVPPAAVDTPAQLEMYNRLRWYGLGPPEALTGSAAG